MINVGLNVNFIFLYFIIKKRLRWGCIMSNKATGSGMLWISLYLNKLNHKELVYVQLNCLKQHSFTFQLLAFIPEKILRKSLRCWIFSDCKWYYHLPYIAIVTVFINLFWNVFIWKFYKGIMVSCFFVILF